MRIIHARNVHRALPEGMHQLKYSGVTAPSRNGPVRMMPCPVTTVYKSPRERVLFHPERDANPFFHLMESLWMLGGRNDVAWLASFLPRMRSYSDDGVTFHGAYGHRWRVAFGYDQLQGLKELLDAEPNTRRAVLQIWSAQDLRSQESKDLPCNTQVYFWQENSQLNMTVCNRSNDIIWGTYGANAVHFSMLQEVLASSLGWEVGAYWQISNNFHAYEVVFKKMLPLADKADNIYDGYVPCPYDTTEVKPFPVMSIPSGDWFQELRMFLEEGPVMGMKEPFFRHVATPMLMAYRKYQEMEGIERYRAGRDILMACRATDWRKAGEEWFDRRLVRHEIAQDDGVNYET